MDFAHLMETFTNPDTIHSLHIYDKMIVSAFSMFIGISITLVTLTLVYIAMKMLAVVCRVVLSIDSGSGGVLKRVRGKKGVDKTGAGNANANDNVGGGNADANDDDIVAISAAIHAYYAPRLQAGNRIVIRDIRRGEVKTRYGSR